MFKDLQKVLLWTVFWFAVIWASKLPGISLGFIELYPARIMLVLWLVSRLFVKNNSLYISSSYRNAKNSILVFLAICVISILFATNIKASLTGLLVYGTSIGLFFMTKSYINNRTDITFASLALFLNVVVIWGITYWESRTGTYLFETEYRSMSETLDLTNLYRPKTVFYNTNNLSVFLAMTLPICLLFTENLKSKVLFVVGIFAVSSYCMFLTGSRTGLICIALLSLLLLYSNYKTMSSWRLIIVIIFIALLIAASVYFTLFLDLIFQNQSFANEDRIPIWNHYFHIFTNTLLLIGGGIGNSSDLGIQYFNDPIPPHNLLLEVLVETGLLGIFFFMRFIKSCIPSLYSIKTSDASRLLMTFFIIFAICSITPSSMTGYYWIWAILGLCIAIKEENEINIL